MVEGEGGRREERVGSWKREATRWRNEKLEGGRRRRKEVD